MFSLLRTGKMKTRLGFCWNLRKGVHLGVNFSEKGGAATVSLKKWGGILKYLQFATSLENTFVQYIGLRCPRRVEGILHKHRIARSRYSRGDAFCNLTFPHHVGLHEIGKWCELIDDIGHFHLGSRQERLWRVGRRIHTVIENVRSQFDESFEVKEWQETDLLIVLYFISKFTLS